MSIPYLNIARGVLLRTGQFADAVSASAFETVYTSALAAAAGGLELPLSELKRLVLASEKRIAAMCARSKNPILIGPLYGKTASIAHKGQIPLVDSNSKAFIGDFTNIVDASDNTPLTEKPKQVVLRRVRNAGSFYKLESYNYCIEGNRLLHTRTNAIIEGCVWDYTTQDTAYGANGSSPLAQELESMWVADCLANAPQEDWFIQEAGLYAQIVSKCEQDIYNGLIPAPILPDSTASAEPVKN